MPPLSGVPETEDSGFATTDQVAPFHFSIRANMLDPLATKPSAIQNDDDTHDTPYKETRPPGSARGALVHVPSLSISASAAFVVEPTTMQNVVSGQEIAAAP